MENGNVSPINGSEALASSQNRVLRNTYLLLAVSMIPTIAGAALGVSMGFKGFGAWWVNLIVLLGAVMAFSYAIERTKNSGAGVAILLGFTFFMGFWLSVLLGRILSLKDGATLIMYAFGGTAVIFTAMATIASMIKTRLTGMSKFLWVGFFVILLAAIGAIVFKMPALMIACSVLFIGLFAAWTVYDLNQIITGGETNYVSATLSIYINVFNIFSNLLSLLGLTSSD
ncbi:MAG: BAX inhibitor (BI)-1/YccA family protein [Burkholderiales bacterium]|nr:MAG: BAX inhibitor (BI)-1/YccA family protein [Betaproteobacteria bacterium]TAG28466.1 MAG: BAX inhibitor (BI)-1/YccA family protein [Burkholderiales bacterium]